MTQFVPHPEQRANEAYLGYMIVADFECALGDHDIQRLGTVAYKDDGTAIFPVFVDRETYYARGVHPDFPERSYEPVSETIAEAIAA
jgi:hypothetical protein